MVSDRALEFGPTAKGWRSIESVVSVQSKSSEKAVALLGEPRVGGRRVRRRSSCCEQKQGASQPVGQSELTARGQMLRRTKLFLENLTMGVRRFPFCLTFPCSKPLIGAVGQRPGAAPLGTEAEHRPAGTRLL